MLLHAKWDVYHNIDLQFGGKRSQISNSDDALGVYHHKCSANFSDPSVWPIPVRLWSFQQPLCAILYVLKLTQIGGKRSQILKWLWFENLKTYTELAPRSWIFCSDEQRPYQF